MNIVFNPQDEAWIKRKIREEFDTPKEFHNTDEYFQLIEMAKRLGFYELAQDMTQDLPYTPVFNPYQ